MIRVTCLGHIGTAVGAREIELPNEKITARQIVESMRARSKVSDPGFNIHNTLVLVDNGEAFVPGATDAMVAEGGRVVLIPISHGG